MIRILLQSFPCGSARAAIAGFIERVDRAQLAVLPGASMIGFTRTTPFAPSIGQLDIADRQEPSEPITLKKAQLNEKLAKLREETAKLAEIEKRVQASADKQVSLTDPDSRSKATSDCDSAVVDYNVQIAIGTEHHLIVHHEVTTLGTARA